MKPNPVLTMNHELQGLISAKVFDATGNVVREVAEFPNLITDSGMNTFFSNSAGLAEFAVCKVGTGAGSPTASDTALPGGIARQYRTGAAVGIQNTTAPYYMELTQTFLFALGAISGTLTCIGVSMDNSNNTTIHAWSQIKDSGNNPTTITVLSTEQLQVTYKLRMYAPTFTSSPTLNIAGDATYSTTVYAQRFDSAGFWASTGTMHSRPNQINVQNWATVTPPANITSQVSFTGNTTALFTVSYAAYTNGNFYRDGSISMSTTEGNIGGIKGFVLSGSGSCNYFVNLNGTIPKDNTKTLTLSFRISASRYSS